MHGEGTMKSAGETNETFHEYIKTEGVSQTVTLEEESQEPGKCYDLMLFELFC